MKKKLYAITTLVFMMGMTTPSEIKSTINYGLEKGNPEIQSISKLSFGPDGILFIGDSKAASVFAVNTDDSNASEQTESINVKQFGLKLASALGTTPENLVVNDMVVNPLSGNPYFAVSTAQGNHALLVLINGELQAVDLSNIEYSKMQLEDVVDDDAKDRRGRPLRIWAISYMHYVDGALMLSGLSNKEFGSTFRKIPFPFEGTQDYATLEIYHAAHARYETQAPIKTFTTTEINGEEYLVASYTCTPLVLFPTKALKGKVHVKGRTVAEMGSGNSPLDIISMENEGKKYLLMSNSNRPVMKVKYDDLVSYQGSLTKPVEEFAQTAGVGYISLPLVNVIQLAKVDDTNFMILQRRSNGDLDLRSLNKRWL